MLLSQHPETDEDAKLRKAKIVNKVFELKEIESAILMLDRKDRLEKQLLLTLRKHTNGYFNAF